MRRSIGSIAGLQQLKERFDIGSAGPELREDLSAQAEAIAEQARETLRQEHPGGTGALARSVTVVESGTEEAPRFSVGTSSPVGRYLEFGTRRMAAQPWLNPALHRLLPNVKQSAVSVLSRILRSERSQIR